MLMSTSATMRDWLLWVDCSPVLHAALNVFINHSNSCPLCDCWVMNCPLCPPAADPLAGGERADGAPPRSGPACVQRGCGGRHGTDSSACSLSEWTQDCEQSHIDLFNWSTASVRPDVLQPMSGVIFILESLEYNKKRGVSHLSSVVIQLSVDLDGLCHMTQRL